MAYHGMYAKLLRTENAPGGGAAAPDAAAVSTNGASTSKGGGTRGSNNSTAADTGKCKRGRPSNAAHAAAQAGHSELHVQTLANFADVHAEQANEQRAVAKQSKKRSTRLLRNAAAANAAVTAGDGDDWRP